MRLLVVASGLSIASLMPAVAETAKPPVQLTPHRAVYDLSLLRAGGSNGVENARGRIAMEFVAFEACEMPHEFAACFLAKNHGAIARKFPQWADFARERAEEWEAAE